MTVRRISLTVLGFAGSVLAALMLCVSAQSILSTHTVPAHSSLSHTIQFPYAVPNTDLVIQSLNRYDGPFLEDGTDREVFNIAALTVRNTGKTMLESARIVLCWNTGAYTFCGSYLPAGGTAVLLEQDAQAFRSDRLIHCTGAQTAVQADRNHAGIIAAEEAMGTVILTNPTDSPIYGITLYYKTWLLPQEMYIGGITYGMEIAHLQPGQSLRLYPDHYAVGYSKIVCIQGHS